MEVKIMGEKCCGKMAEGCCGTMGAESLHRMHSHCADCKGELNSKTHTMDTSASEGGAGGGHGALCDSCFVGGSKMRLDKRADTATVEEPDWIPDGDGRAIGQQDFAINLSPLHAEDETVFEELIVPSKDGYTVAGVDYDIRALKEGNLKVVEITYGKDDEYAADTVGSPSPTFDEGITGQDGPSADPTNATFEARARYGPQEADMKRARDTLIRRGYAKDNGDILQDEFLYNDEPSKKTGRKADKYHYFAVIENNGRYYAINIYGPSRGNQTVINILGATGDKANSMVSTGSVSTALSAWNDKKKAKARKGYRPILFGQKGSIDIYGAEETLAEIEGPTAEATSGGLHSPSSFTMSWEDGAGYSSASIPPNEIAWAETSGIPTWVKAGAGLVLLLAGGSFLKSKMSEQKAADNLKSAIKSRKGCGCGSRKTFNAYNRMGIAESQDEQTCRANGGMWIHGDRNTPSHCEYGEDTLPKGGGLQNALDGGVTFQSEYSVGQINPVEVEGQNDIYGAEDYRLSTPQVSQPNWGPQTTYRQNPRRNLKMW